MTQVVSFIIQKGGCGKTTTTANTGGYLARQGFKILCVDMDPQGNLTQHFGYNNETLKNTILQLFQKEKDFEEVVLHRSENLHVLPNNIETAAAELPLYHTLSREFMLRDVLYPVMNQYDYILIDCPPALGLFSINSLAASTEFIMVIAPEFFPMKAIKPLYETYNMVKQKLNHTLRFSGVVLTMCDFRTRHSQEVLKIIMKNFPHKLYKSFIRLNVTLKEASSFGQTIFEYDDNSVGAFDYQNFAEEFIRDHHKSIAKRKYYEDKFQSMSEDEQGQVMMFAHKNLSAFNRTRFETDEQNEVVQTALITERNKIIEKLFPYREHSILEKIENG